MEQVALFSTDWVEQEIKDTRRGILSIRVLNPIFTTEEWYARTQSIQEKANLIRMEHDSCEEYCAPVSGFEAGLAGLISLRNHIGYWFELALWCDPQDLETEDWEFIDSRLNHCWNLIQGAVTKLPAVTTVHNLTKINGVVKDIIDTYRDPATKGMPWKLPVSWGKDSTSVVQLVLEALFKLSPNEWVRPIYLVTSDTRLELPPMLQVMRKNLKDFEKYSHHKGLPITVQVVEPSLEERFFTNLIGKGYTVPLGGPVKRWCTPRLKLQPQARLDKKLGNSVAVLGTRYSESASREKSMKKWAGESRYGYTSTPGVLSYTPIAHLQLNQVWDILKHGFWWGDNYQMLADLYRASSFDEQYDNQEESALIGGRMGCAICFVVKRDKALENMVSNGYEWLSPLLDYREFIRSIESNRFYREPVPIDRRTALPTTRKARNPDKVTMGGINQKGRELLLAQLLETQDQLLSGMNQSGSQIEGGYELISPEEIHWIKSWWHHLSGYTESGFIPVEVVEKPPKIQISLF